MSKRSRRREAGATACCGDLGSLLAPRFFRALADPSRIALLVRLAVLGAPSTVSELAACCPTDLSVVSRHLAMLRDAGVLAAEKRGRQVYYSVRYAALADSLRSIADAIASCCPPGAACGGGARRR